MRREGKLSPQLSIGINREIINGWLDRVREDTERAGHNVNPSDLRDGIGDYLKNLADALRNSESAEIGGTDAWKRVAKEHALTRVRLGFDIDQLVHEFVILRRVTQQIAIDPSDGLQIVMLADLIDAAIATSVKSYVESRDYRTRQQEEEHLGFLTHELRNPLTTASLAASQLRKDPGLNPQVPAGPRPSRPRARSDQGAHRTGASGRQARGRPGPAGDRGPCAQPTSSKRR